jgi:ATP-dependent exoDNAse (exonuclease V) alpha subunit
LTRAIARPTNKQLVESVAVSTVGVSEHEEQKANEIVAAILDNAESQITDYEREYEAEAVRAYESYDDDEYDSEDEPSAPSTALLPPLETCGLWNPEITLDDSQVEAVRALTDKQYGCLIGAAGTGKTTCQKYLLKNLLYGDKDSELEPQMELRKLPGKQGLNIAMVAFTGMAVQVIKSNLPAWMHPAAKTIHGLLEFMPEEFIDSKGKKSRRFVPSRHNLNKLDHDIIIIDEASMVGLDLWKQLLAACKPGTRIIMCGDLNQLPPIIGMPVFAFALSHWHVSELTKVHRQKEEGANRIIEVAHQILRGEYPTFDQTKGNPHWRVAQFTLSDKAKTAFEQIVNVLNALRHQRLDPVVDPDQNLVWDPYRDRVMTAGNGYDENTESSLVQQAPLNDALSRIILPPKEDHPRFIIDAGRRQPKFAVGYRVMATKNEPPDMEDRITNGMTGRIEEIIENDRYTGDRKLVGEESAVRAELKSRVNSMLLQGESLDAFANRNTDDLESDLGVDDGDFSISADAGEEEAAAGGGFASHTVVVRFDNGATRRFASKAGVESLYLAYASTVAKCQGSQFDTAIIVVHAAQKGQLCREWLYTAVTRATKRVIILKTDYGLRLALGRQKIHGKTLAEKIERYKAMLSEEGVKMAYGGRMRANVPLRIEDFDGATPGVEYF